MKKKLLITALLFATVLTACGKKEIANEPSAQPKTQVEIKEETESTKEETPDFFAVKQITSVSNETPTIIYSTTEPQTSLNDELQKYRDSGYEMYNDQTWYLIDRDNYYAEFPYGIVDGNIDITKDGETFTEMIERVGYQMVEMFAKEDLYDGHEQESVTYRISEDGKRACIIYYDAKEKSVNVLVFTHLARQTTSQGVVRDYYTQTITGADTTGLDADNFYAGITKLFGINFDGDIQQATLGEMQIVPGGAKDIVKVSNWRLQGLGKEYSATELINHTSKNQSILNYNFEDTNYYDPNKTEIDGINGIGTINFTIEDDVWKAFKSYDSGNIKITELVDTLNFNGTRYTSLEDYLAAYKEQWYYEGKDARNYFKYLVSEDGKNAVSIFDSGYTGNENTRVVVALYQQIGTCTFDDGQTVPIYRITSFSNDENCTLQELYNRLNIWGIELQ